MLSTPARRLGGVAAFALAVALAIGHAASAAILPATPATLSATFAKAQAGDTLALAPGAYGDGDFARRFASPVTIAAADPLKPPSFRTLSATYASNLVFAGLRVDFTPTASTVTWSWATRIQESDHVTFSNVRIVGGPAVAGLNEDGSGVDVGGNIIGRPTAYGLLINHSSDVLVEGGEVASFYKGVVLQWTQRVTLKGVDLHDMRTTAIVGADNSDLTVQGNWLHAAHPWRWGNGDHADLLALWSNATQATPNARVRITGNRMEQLAGEAILGMWLQGSAAAPFVDFEVVGNQIVVNNLQGVLINNARGGTIADNRLYRATAGDAGQSPTILIRENTSAIVMRGNLVGAPISDTGGGANPQSGNVTVAGDANILPGASPASPTPVPAPTPAPPPQPAPAPAPAPLPDIVVRLLPGQTVATSKPGKTYKPKPGQRAVFIAPN